MAPGAIARAGFRSAAVLSMVVLCTLLAVTLDQGLLGGGGSADSVSVTRALARPGGIDRGLATVPAGARAPVSATLGADSQAYRVTASGQALQAHNPAQRLSARFERRGVQLRSGDLTVAMRLRALGFDGEDGVGNSQRTLDVLAAPPVKDAANRVSYSHQGLSEWYVNGPLGVEQGYTIPRRPLGENAENANSVTLSIALLGNGRATLSQDAKSILFNHGATSLRYGGLTVTDATGRTLPAGLALAGTDVRLRIDTDGARYPLRVDPLIEQGEKLTGSGEQGEGQFGLSVALSADGDTALIGGPHDQGFAGSVWVFTRSGDSWSQQGEKLTSGEAEDEGEETGCDEETGEEAGECGFGRGLALSADGDTALIGAPRVAEQQGAAWVYTRTGNAWTRGEKLVGGSEETREGRLGRSVALSADGDTALVGAPADRNRHGSAWVFTRSGSSWSQQGAKLAGTGESGEAHFAGSVALSADGNTALMGAPGDGGLKGTAWVFTRSGSSWSQQGAKLVGAGEEGAGHLGGSVALSADGDTALLGARQDAGNLGAAWAFTRTAGSWSQQGAKLRATGESTNGEFGYSVALSADGATALIGAPHDNAMAGSVRVFTRAAGAWTAQPEQLAGAGELGRGWFGASVAISADAKTALVGAPRDRGRAGAAWGFAYQAVPTRAPVVAKVTPRTGPQTGGTSVRITGTDFTAASAVRFGTLGATSFTVRSATLIEAVSPPAPPGAVDVTVSTSAGTSAIDPANDRFAYTGSTPTNPDSPPGAGAPPTGGATGAGGGVLGAGSGVLGFTSAPSGRCQISLGSKRIAVLSYRSAALRLLRTGAGSCRGKLTLRYKVKGKRYTLKTIGVAGFSIPAGKSQVVKIALNATGRALMRAGHGRLNASLAIVRQQPTPLLGRTASVRLSVKKAPRQGIMKK